VEGGGGGRLRARLKRGRQAVFLWMGSLSFPLANGEGENLRYFGRRGRKAGER